MEALEERPGVDAEPVGEGGAGLAVDVEGFGAASGAVEGEHAQGREAFAVRVGAGEVGEFGGRGIVVAEVEAGFEVLLAGEEPILAEPGGGVAEGAGVGEALVGVPAPEALGGGVLVGGGVEASGGAVAAGGGGAGGEHGGVEVRLAHVDAVSAGAQGDPFGFAEGAAEAVEAHEEGVAGVARRAGVPHRLGEVLDRDGPSRTGQERREQPPLEGPAQRQGSAAGHLQGPEDAEPERLRVCLHSLHRPRGTPSGPG
nr:hypothetical protein GCM10025732_17230 [Glycomyces mayteni]